MQATRCTFSKPATYRGTVRAHFPLSENSTAVRRRPNLALHDPELRATEAYTPR